MTLNPTRLNTLSLKDVSTSQRGAKSCAIVDADGGPLTFQLGSRDKPVTSPFGASNFGDDTSAWKTIEFSLDDAQAFESVAEWARAYLYTHSERLFKKKLSMEAIRENFRPPATQKGDYRPLLRCKITTAGSHAVRCWNSRQERVDLPEDLRGIPVVAKIALERLWIMSKEYGLVMTVTDLMISDDATSQCPFEEASAFG